MDKHELWLAKAASDLRLVALALKNNDEAVFESAIYHTQQAAEKSLKAFLVL